MAATGASVERWRSALEPLLADPGSAAVLCDLDGTIAPIVARPGLVAVPARARRALELVAGRFGLCAIVTGRRPEVAREIVGLDEIAYAGNHGYELLAPGASVPVASPALEGHLDDVADFVRSHVDPEVLAGAGVRLEDKGPIMALHWRGVGDEAEAERVVGEVADSATGHGLAVHHGRKVVELRPSVEIDKGVAIAALVDAAPVRAALYAGDDRTDLDGFGALARMREEGRLDHVVRVGVRSPEGPRELTEAADLVVTGPGEVADLLVVLGG